MIKDINSKNFDVNFKKLLETKKGDNFVKGRLDIEHIDLKSKSNFVIQFLHSLKSLESLTIKVLFWENDRLIEGFLGANLKNRKCDIENSYKNTEIPGFFYLEDSYLNEELIKLILDNHFNYELGEDPSLNIRVQICVNLKSNVYLLDIYDDRGFDIYISRY